MSTKTLVSTLMAAASVAAIACSSSGGGANGNGTPSGTPVEQGQAYVQARMCGNCHTSDLSGSTSALPNYPDYVKLYPPNLTPDTDTGVGNWTDTQLQDAIRNGVDNMGEVLCPQMKHYGDMQDDELNAIIAYLRSIPPVKKTIPGSICPPLKQ